VRDQPYLLRIGNHHAADVRTQDLGHRRSVPGRLDHHVIVMGQRSRKRRQAVPTHLDATKPHETPSFQRRGFCEDAVNIQSDDTHPIALIVKSMGATGSTTPTDPRSQRIRASRRGGHVTSSSSQLTV
jgi:hypothetical protein